MVRLRVRSNEVARRPSQSRSPGLLTSLAASSRPANSSPGTDRKEKAVSPFEFCTSSVASA